MDGLEVRRRDMPRPSNAPLQLLSLMVFQSPLDFPKLLVCSFEDTVSRGYKVKSDTETWNL